MAPSRTEVIGMARAKMECHPGLDWTCAVQAVAIEITWNEQELLEDLAPEFTGHSSAYEGENHD